MTRRNYFGSETRAQDGCIVTFELKNGEILVERFSQLVHTKWRDGTKTALTEGDPYTKQAAVRADELGAKILSISTPQTILTDLQGTRASLEAKPTGVEGLRGGMQLGPANDVPFPEIRMLGKIGRHELFKRPDSDGVQARQNIRQMRQRRPSHNGRPSSQ